VPVTVTMSGNAAISSTYLIVDGVVVSEDLTTPYGYTLNTARLTNGSHDMFVRAWDAAGAKDSPRVSFTVANAVPVPTPEPVPVPPPPPPPPPPCTITAPSSINVSRNGQGTISVKVENATGPTTITALGSDGQVTVTPLSKTVTGTSAVMQFSVRVRKQSRTITFQSPCGSVTVKVNVTA